MPAWSYQERRHRETAPNHDHTRTHEELQAHVRHLHTLADAVLPSQRQRLFHDDLENFLATNTSTQLKNYIDLYTPAIRLSTRQASKIARQNTRTLHTYGFVPHPQAAANPAASTPRTHTPSITATAHNPPNHNTTLPTRNNPPPPTPSIPTLSRMRQRLINWARIGTDTRQRAPIVPTPNIMTTTPQNSLDISDSTDSPNHSTVLTNPDTSSPIHHTPTSRAPHHKHSRWRPLALQRQRFLNFFRR